MQIQLAFRARSCPLTLAHLRLARLTRRRVLLIQRRVLDSLGAVQLHEFVVQAQKQECRRPLPYEQSCMVLACDFEGQGSAYGAERRPKK